MNRSFYTDDEVAEMTRLRDTAVGDKDQWTPGKPVKIDGKHVGGIAAERNDLADTVGNDPDTRCYPLAANFQVQTNFHAPCRGTKTDGGEKTEFHKGREALLQVSSIIELHSNGASLNR